MLLPPFSLHEGACPRVQKPGHLAGKKKEAARPPSLPVPCAEANTFPASSI